MITFSSLSLPNFQSYFTSLASDKNKVRCRLLSLKSFVVSMVLASSAVEAQDQEPEPTVVVGSEVSLSAVMKAEWLKGEGPKSFEPGKVYIFECWATWCGPCIAMIPHMNELHKKYYDKGLRVYGMNVWEDDREKADKFIKKKGDKMSYPVAFTGVGGAFEIEWIAAAGAKSIPHAFVVKDGKLLASTQASRLTDSLIETLLSGDDGAKKVADIISSAQNNQEVTDKLAQDIKSASSMKNEAKMTTLLNELKATDPGHPEIGTLELLLLMTRKEWPAAVIALNEMPASESQKHFVLMKGMRAAVKEPDYPADFVKALAQSYSDVIMLSESPIGPNHFACLSILQWRVDDKKKAVITANKGVESAKSSSAGREYLIKAFVRFATSVDAGTMPEYSELANWQREAKKETTEAK